MSANLLAMAMIVLTNSFGRVEIDPRGARVRSYVPSGGQEVFHPVAEPDETGWSAGGIPVCWPWFFDRGPEGAALHGTARSSDFRVLRHTQDLAELELAEGPLVLRMRFELGRRLVVKMATENAGAEPAHVTEGLHAYFSVADVERAALEGLDGVKGTTKRGGDASAPCVFGDRMPLAGANDVCDVGGGVFAIDDPEGRRRIRLELSGMRELAVWNGRACPRGAVCVEPIVFRRPLRLEPGESRELKMSVEALPR